MLRRGFTLIELLVTISVIAVLVSLLIPSLSQSRRHAQRTKSSSNARAIAQLMGVYAAVDQDRYPAAIDGRMYPTSQSHIQTTISWWSVCWGWPALLAPVIGWDELLGVVMSPGARPAEGSPAATSYEYSNSFVGDPKIWSGAALPSPSLRTGRRTSDVAYPSAKVLLFDHRLAFLNRGLTLYGNDLLELSPGAFADGHVATIVQAYASTPILNPFPESSRNRERLHNTRDGVRGRDY